MTEEDELSVRDPEELESLIKQKRKEHTAYQERIESGSKILKDMV
jgi:hypothetical protein